MLALVGLAAPLSAQTAAFNGFCQQGGVSANVSGLPSTNKLNGVIPSCTVTVFLTGTTTKATIFKDSSHTPLSNPFTADSLIAAAPGKWLFYAATGAGYDVTMSGGIAPLVYVQPVTLTGLIVGTGGGGGGGSPVGLGASQFSNIGATAFVNGGQYDIDQYATGGGNNGIANFFASAQCTTTSCLMLRPATSTDTEGIPIITSGKPSYYIEDYEHLQHNEIYANPGLLTGTINNVGGFDLGTFSQTSQGTTQGNPQYGYQDVFNFTAPGFVNDGQGCPTSCPASGFSALGQWALQGYQNITNTFNTSGIRNGRGYTYVFGGIGDFSTETTFEGSDGGVKVPSDEGGYRENSHLFTNGDYFGTVTSITDNLHLKTTPVASSGSQGTGRYIIDNTSLPVAEGTIHTLNFPGESFNAGTVVFDTVTVPISYVWGTVTSCNVPVQEGTVAPATCTLTLQGGSRVSSGVDVTGSGAFDGNGLFCAVQNKGGNIIFGGQVTAVNAPSGTSQTVTININESVSSNVGKSITGYFWQGGTCGMILSLLADNQNYGNDTSQTNSSSYASPGSYDAHTVAYFQPGGSQTWGGIPQVGSFFKTTNTTGRFPGSIPLSNVVRSAGVVTANLFQQGPNQDWINGQTSGMTLSGCSDSSFNGTVLGPIFVTNVGSLSWTDARGNTSCSSGATVTGTQYALAQLYYAAEVLDVRNPANGYAADGYFTHTYQPNFHVGDQLESPPYSNNNFTIQHDFLELSQPCGGSNISCNGYSVIMVADSAYHGAAYEAENGSALNTLNHTSGTGGVAFPADFAHAVGFWSDGFIMDLMPEHAHSVISVGGAPFNLAGSMQNYNVIALETGTGNQTAMVYDMTGQAYGLAHAISFTNGHAGGPGIFPGPLNSMFQIAPSEVVSYVPHVFSTSAIFPFPAVTQFHDAFALRNGTGVGINNPGSYDNLVATPVLTTVGTPGTTSQIYTIAVNYTYGVTFSPEQSIGTGPATLNTSNYIQISCSVIPTNSLGTATVYNATTNGLLKTVGTCANSSAVVNDQGTYGATHANGVLTAGATMYGGAYIANGASGAFGWSLPNIFNDSGANPLNVALQFTTPSANLVSLDTTTAGNHLGNLTMNNLTVASCSGCGGGSLPSGTTNQLLYYATSGTTLTPLTLGTNLSITTGVLNATSTAATAFSALTSATNTSAAMVVGAGASLNFTSTGTINASTVGGVALAGLCQTGGTGCPSIPWNTIANPSGNLALAMGSDSSSFTYNATTGSGDMFKLTDTTSNTGTGVLLHATTANASTEIPFQADANGCGWKVAADGSLQGVGTGCGTATISLPGSSSGAALIQAAAAAGTPTLTLPTATGTLSETIASGQTAIPTTSLAGNTCDASATTATATGALTTDSAIVSYASDPTGVTGYGGGTSGGISIRAWFTSNTFNFKRCNESSTSITSGTLSLNWRDVR